MEEEKWTNTKVPDFVSVNLQFVVNNMSTCSLLAGFYLRVVLGLVSSARPRHFLFPFPQFPVSHFHSFFAWNPGFTSSHSNYGAHVSCHMLPIPRGAEAALLLESHANRRERAG